MCRLSVSLLLVECRWRSSSGTQLAERPGIKQIAAEVPLEELQRHSTDVPLEKFQRHSTVRNVLNQVYCRRRAAGEVPAALNWQKGQESSKLPRKCRWRNSSGTQLAERPGIKQIAAEVPLEELQRHSTVRNVLNQVYCRRRAAGEVPAALNRPEIKQIAVEVALEKLQRHLNGRNPTNPTNPKAFDQKGFHISSLASM